MINEFKYFLANMYDAYNPGVCITGMDHVNVFIINKSDTFGLLVPFD